MLQDTLFADLETYEYMAYEQLAITAWYVATEFEDAYDVGLEAAQTLAARFPGDTEKAGNVAWYESLRESEPPPLGLCADFPSGNIASLVPCISLRAYLPSCLCLAPLTSCSDQYFFFPLSGCLCCFHRV